MASRTARSFQIGLHDVDQFLGSDKLRGIFAFILVQNVKPDVPLDQLRHKTVERSATGGYELQQIAAFLFFFQCPFDGLDLPADAANADQEPLFIASGIGHFA